MKHEPPISSASANGFFHFPRTDVEGHPLYRRLTGPGRLQRHHVWLRRAAVMAVPLALMLLANVSGNAILLLLAFPAIDTVQWTFRALGFEELRRSGMLRDLCLAGQSPLLTVAAYNESTRDNWGTFVAMLAGTAAMPFLIPAVAAIWFALVVTIAIAQAVGWILTRDSRGSVSLPRKTVILLLRSERRHLAVAVAIWAVLLIPVVAFTSMAMAVVAVGGIVELILIDRMLRTERYSTKCSTRSWRSGWRGGAWGAGLLHSGSCPA